MEDIEVVGAAIRDGGRILAAQRSPVMSSALKWEFVGGKVEVNETHRQALRREVFEELGVRIKVNRYIASGTSTVEGKKIRLHVYEAEIIEGTPQAREHSQIQWINIKDMEKLDWADADIPASKRLQELYGHGK
ncbi:MAG: (deoxy)nucleoside triphosphate pyrophosphohydrolase [Clostridiales bacterium]|jgi:8-oxo-dGTP diphosphatase|nr:(deoxy)nucleoside triphosphate pyrophosphohydrolase [Eubacteriales bacterium]MDH7565424.1 (deoxy)nucleoside triphosphate pyrophosphohydrolase [Clostridiales bacterium]